MPFKIDLHTHSFFSGDGVSSPEENIASAKAKGLHGFALTDHNTNDGVTYLLEKGLMREDGMPVDDFLIIPGVEVTTALFETAMMWMAYHATGYLASGEVPKPQGSGTAMIAPYQAFPTADGYALIGAASDALFTRLARALGCPGLLVSAPHNI
jgi:hypothetical protein